MQNENSPRIFIVILNWNGRKDTLECLRSVEKINYFSFQTIVVDNGSTDGSADAIRAQFPKIALLEEKENLGFAGGNNVGIRHALQAGAEAVLLLNNDTCVDPHLLTHFAEQLKSHPQAGILGATILLYDEKEKLDHLGGFWNKKKAAFDFVGHRETLSEKHAKVQELEYVCGACILIRRDVFEKIGLLEPRFFLIWEEADFCFRAKNEGFLVLTSPSAKIWHKVSSSFVGGKPHTNYFWWRNRLFWIERNRPFGEIVRLAFSVLLPEIFHLLKLRFLKSIQLACFGFRLNSEERVQKKAKILQYRAALQGVKDYLLRKFGKGPTWIYQR
jgi:GT2 family glycosyltransferase